MKINEVRQLDEFNPFNLINRLRGKADDVAKVAEPKPLPNINWKGRGEYAGLSYDAKNKVVGLPNGNKVPVAGPDEGRKVIVDYLKAQGKTPPHPKQKSTKAASKKVTLSVEAVEAARRIITSYVIGIEFADAYIYYASQGFTLANMTEEERLEFFGKVAWSILMSYGIGKLAAYGITKQITKGDLDQLAKITKDAFWKRFLKAFPFIAPPFAMGFADMPKEVWAEFERSIGLE